MKCELLKIEQVIGETITQATISEMLRVPESKPGIEQIVSIDGFVRVGRIEVIEDKVIVHGRLHVGVVYVGLLDPQAGPLHARENRIHPVCGDPRLFSRHGGASRHQDPGPPGTMRFAQPSYCAGHVRSDRTDRE